MQHVRLCLQVLCHVSHYVLSDLYPNFGKYPVHALTKMKLENLSSSRAKFGAELGSYLIETG